MGKQETLETIWEVPGRALGTDRTYHPGGRTRPKPGAASALTHDRCSTASSSGCAAGANGTDCRKSLGTTAPFIAPFNGGWGRAVLHRMWGALVGGVRRVGWRGLGMAGGRRSHGQGTFWGDLIGPNPTDRGKAGTKRSLLVDGEGGPLSIVVAGANVHDAKLLEATLDAIVVERPQPTEEEPQHLCLDKGYDNPSGRGAAAGHGYRGAHPTHRRGEAGTPLATSGIRRAGGLWNGRWHGSPSAVRSWSGTTRRQRTTSVCYSSHVALLWFRRQWRLAILR